MPPGNPCSKLKPPFLYLPPYLTYSFIPTTNSTDTDDSGRPYRLPQLLADCRLETMNAGQKKRCLHFCASWIDKAGFSASRRFLLDAVANLSSDKYIAPLYAAFLHDMMQGLVTWLTATKTNDALYYLMPILQHFQTSSSYYHTIIIGCLVHISPSHALIFLNVSTGALFIELLRSHSQQIHLPHCRHPGSDFQIC